MSTKIGVIAEGPIDHILLSALLVRIAEDKARFTWPVHAEDVAELLPIRKRGQGGVLDTVRKLVKVLDKEPLDYECIIILLDHRTRGVQRIVRRLIRGRDRFVLGIAIEEIEAWWLGDRTNTLAWSGLSGGLPGNCRYAARNYQAERDRAPKKTLDELTRLSDRFDRYYGAGNTDLANEFVDDYWRERARLEEIALQCPKGFACFQNDMTGCFHRVKSARGLLF